MDKFYLALGLIVSIFFSITLTFLFITWCIDKIVKHLKIWRIIYDYARYREDFKEWKNKNKTN